MSRGVKVMLAGALVVGAAGAAWAETTSKTQIKAQSQVRVQPLLKAGVGALALKLQPVQVRAACHVGDRNWVLGDEFLAEANDDGSLKPTARGATSEQLKGFVKAARSLAISGFTEGKLLVAGDRRIQVLDLESLSLKPLVDLNGILIGMNNNDRLIRMGEIAGIAASDERFLFVATEAGYSSSIFKIDLASNRVVAQEFAPGPTPAFLQLDGESLFLVDRNSQLLRQYDRSLKMNLKSIPIDLKGVRAVLVRGDEVRTMVEGSPTVQRKTQPVKAQLRTTFVPTVTPAVIERLKDVLAINLARKYAVLICGDVAESGFDEFWNDPLWMYKMLKAKGYAAKDIFVLYGYGTDFVSANPFYKVAETVTDFAATPANVNMVLDGLKNGDAAHGLPKVDDNDSLFIWTFDHGGLTGGGEATLCLRGGSLTASQFAAKANAISYGKRAIFCQQCFSGGFIPALKNAKTYISTACKGDETAHEADTEYENYGGKVYHHGEYNYYLIGGFDKKYPNGVGCNPDTAPANGKVSAKEANQWWVSHENRPETPQQNDMGGVGPNFHLN